MTAPSAFTLYKNGVIEYLLKQNEVRLTELSKQFTVNEGYLNVALRVLASNLKDQYYITLGDLLNVRSFLDHNCV